MKNKTLWNILMLAVLVLQLAAEVLTAIAVVRLNMVPDKYLIIMTALMVLFVAATALLMFIPGKNGVGMVRRIIACVLAVLISIGCALVAKVAMDFRRTVETVTVIEEEVSAIKIQTTARNVYVLVAVEDPAQTLQDAKDYTFGFTEDYDPAHTDNAIEKIGEKVSKTIVTKPYSRFAEMAQALYDGEVGALIINGAGVKLIAEDALYGDFEEKVRILDTLPFVDLEDPEAPPPVIENPEPVVVKDITNTPFVVYISGSDIRSSKLALSRSDVNILAVVNPETKQVLLINTPRDYYVANPMGNGAMDKLTHCGLYGPECSMEVLEELYDLQVNYYGQINFTGFEALVDAVGGVTIYSDQSFTARDTYISYGENHLDGAEALDFVRERYRVSGGDNGRGKNQMKLLKAVIEKMTTGTTIISNYSAILGSLEGMFRTNLSMDEISMLVKMQLGDMATWNIQSFAVTGVGDSAKTYSNPGVYAYVMREDENATAYAAQLAARVIAGETLTDADMKLPK